MIRYLVRRLLLLVPVLLALTVVIFLITRLLPGDPAGLAAGPHATRAQVEEIAREFGMDQPLPVQYWRYLTGLVSGDWGRSLMTRRPVFEDIAMSLPATLELVVAALALAILVGIPLGLMAAVTRNRWPDMLARGASLAAISMPRFFLGLLLQLGFAMSLALLPLSGRFPLVLEQPPTVTGLLTIDSLIAGDLDAFTAALRHLILPATAMALSPLASIMRMMRASTIEVLQQDYVLTERALGLSPRLILFKYVFRNAVTSTLTVIGLYIGWMLGGTVLVETVFDWPGIGFYATQAILNQDFMPIAGVALCIGVIFVTMNLLVDLLYGVANPRVKYA